MALRIVGWLLVLFTVLQLALPHFAWERALGVGAGIGMAIVAALVVLLLVRLFRRGPLRFWWGLLLTTAILAITVGILVSPQGFAAILAAVIASVVLLGGGIAMWWTHGFTRPRALATAIGAVGTISLVIVSLLPGWSGAAPPTRTPQTVAALDLPDPGATGPFRVQTLTYGSGRDAHRDEFGANADLVTEPVDGSRLIEGWSGPAGWARTQYWGFDAKRLPRQGRVWFPDGDGPFPLVLMVHGNHDMEDFSDPGYAYLGELFASRGIIAVSVDENFLNSSYADLLGGFKGGLKKENDARGWMLLEHLRLWRQWNERTAAPLPREGRPRSHRVDRSFARRRSGRDRGIVQPSTVLPRRRARRVRLRLQPARRHCDCAFRRAIRTAQPTHDNRRRQLSGHPRQQRRRRAVVHGIRSVLARRLRRLRALLQNRFLSARRQPRPVQYELGSQRSERRFGTRAQPRADHGPRRAAQRREGDVQRVSRSRTERTRRVPVVSREPRRRPCLARNKCRIHQRIFSCRRNVDRQLRRRRRSDHRFGAGRAHQRHRPCALVRGADSAEVERSRFGGRADCLESHRRQRGPGTAHRPRWRAHTAIDNSSFSLAMADKSPLEDDTEWKKPDVDRFPHRADRSRRRAALRSLFEPATALSADRGHDAQVRVPRRGRSV